MARLLDDNEEKKPSDLTEYVVTRWWRAPEVMVAQSYGFEIDVWSAGTIYAELVLRRPLFRGKDYADQLRKILGILGTPSDEEIEAVPDSGARDFIRSLPKYPRVPWVTLFPNLAREEIALIDAMLAYNPKQRFTVAQALSSPVFDQIRDTASEVVEPHTLHLDFDDAKLESFEDVNRAINAELERASNLRAARCEGRQAHLK